MKTQKLDIGRLDDMIKEGYITENKHPNAPLYIYNYTAKTQYSKFWNDLTLACRGLILDADKNIIAHPLPKFFNLSEVEPHKVPKRSFNVYEKLDGSLGILYWYNNEPYMATRGSFTSTQAQKANKMLHEKYADILPLLDVSKTYLFEIIYPDNRIVVDYGKQEKLVLLSVLDTQTGKEEDLPIIGFPLPETYQFNSLTQLKQLDWQNHEGFVLHFSNNERLKIKFDNYKRLHALITQISSITIWEMLKNNDNLDIYLENVPDEFYGWIKQTERNLKDAYSRIEEVAKKEFRVLATDKETALYFNGCSYPSVLFAMWKRKSYAPRIWRLIRPKYEKPFVNIPN